ncbi:MAG TPA: carbohydrate kinase family protein [Actinomycetota bacterium]|nr:carbohydrate kinase family protein [Actinomycetota bacterium]
MPAEFDLLVLGDANPDLVLRGDVEPAFGQAEKLVDDARLVVGGSGAIAACGAARLGLRVAFVAVVGDDEFGRFMLDELASRGVDTRGCVVDPHRQTGVSVVLSRGEDRAILTAPGTIGDLRGELVDRELLRSSRHVHVSSFFLQRSLRADLPGLFDEAHEAGATTSVDPNWDPSGRWDGGLLELLERTDCFFPNSVEARAIAGIDDVDVAAGVLAERGAIIAVKFGQGGGLVMAGQEVARSESIAAEVVDTTGAGDSFDAGFLAGRLNGWPLSRCLQLAVACGSLSTRAAGGTAGQPTMEEALSALEAA